MTIDSTDASVDYNGSGTGYTDRGYTLANTSSGYIKKIMGENASGFVPNDNSGSDSTYWCDRGRVGELGSVPYFGGHYLNKTSAGAFYLVFFHPATYSSAQDGSRLAFCG